MLVQSVLVANEPDLDAQAILAVSRAMAGAPAFMYGPTPHPAQT
jgi:hypothetical protein